MKVSLIAALIALVAIGCSSQSAPPSSPATVQVVATTTVFADLVGQVGGERVSVRSLVPKGGEVHTFDPTPSDAAALAGADLLVMNGLGLDDWLEDFAAEAAAGDAPVLKLAVDLEGVDYIEGGEHHDEDEDVNPHVWMNPGYASLYVDRIEAELVAIDPSGEPTYRANAASARDRLATLDELARTTFGAVPAANRRMVSFHDALPYFAAAYEIEVVGVVVDAPGQDPSAGEVAALIDAIRTSGVTVIVSESQFSPDLVETIAAETAASVVSDVYTDTLGDAPVDTYEGAIRHDIDRIAAAMR